MNRDGPFVAAGVGAAVTIGLSFLPFSSVLGGIAGSSRGDGGYLSGLGVGTAAGIVVMIPLLALFVPAV